MRVSNRLAVVECERIKFVLEGAHLGLVYVVNTNIVQCDGFLRSLGRDLTCYGAHHLHRHYLGYYLQRHAIFSIIGHAFAHRSPQAPCL
jgi:hypothetical protein